MGFQGKMPNTFRDSLARAAHAQRSTSGTLETAVLPKNVFISEFLDKQQAGLRPASRLNSAQPHRGSTLSPAIQGTPMPSTATRKRGTLVSPMFQVGYTALQDDLEDLQHQLEKRNQEVFYLKQELVRSEDRYRKHVESFEEQMMQLEERSRKLQVSCMIRM
jgi:hypothetical protein